MTDLYAMLDVPQDASPAAIRAAWRTKAKIAHPDTGGDVEAFQELHKAFRVLCDPELRARYDKTGAVDEVALRNIEELYRQELLTIFSNTVQQYTGMLDEIDITAVMRASLAATRDERIKQIASVKADSGRLLRLRKRIVREGEGENLFARVLDEQIKAGETIIAKCEESKRIIELCIEELSQYTSAVEMIRMQQAVWGMGGGASATTGGFITIQRSSEP